MFLGLLGLKNAGFTVGDPATLVGLGDMASAPVVLAAAGLVAMTALQRCACPAAS